MAAVQIRDHIHHHSGSDTGAGFPMPAAARSRSSEVPPGMAREGLDRGLCWRELGSPDAPAVVVLGGISADRQVDSWWRRSVGAGLPLDADRFRILSFDWPAEERGSAFGTDGCADALAALLDARAIPSLAAIIGSSFGAMVALAFAARHPARVGRIVAIGGAHRSTPSATAARVLQRAIIRAALDAGRPSAGVALARALALTSYRPAGLFDRRFFREDPDALIRGLTRYFEHNGEKFAQSFDATRYLVLSEALDRHRVDPRSIQCPVDLIGADSDQLVPFAQLRALAGAIGMHARLYRIESEYGHDAFLKSPERINPVLESILGHLTDPPEAEHGVRGGRA